MEVRKLTSCRKCCTCGKTIPIDGLAIEAQGNTLCIKCIKDISKARVGEFTRPVLEFSRETFVKLP